MFVSESKKLSPGYQGFFYHFAIVEMEIENPSSIDNPVWVMSSAFASVGVEKLVDIAQDIGAQGIDLCVFRHDGSRTDHVATHLDYDHFGLDDAKRLLDLFNERNLKLSVGAFENMIGGDPRQRRKNQDHLLKLIRIAHLLGGQENDVAVGTFVGYNHELGAQENGFEKNLISYQKTFEPIIRYAEDLGVQILYENCPMEGWRGAAYSSTYNNLPGVLAARKLMYALIPSDAHGEIYDPSHDIWQNTDPVEVIKASDITRIKRIHVKTTRRLVSKGSVEWGGMYAMQHVNPALAKAANINVPANEWDRHHYEAMLPGFGGTDHMDWTNFIQILKEKRFTGPFEIENEAVNSKGTGNLAAIIQGFKAATGFLSPLLWSLDPEKGYAYSAAQGHTPKVMKSANRDIPIQDYSSIS